MHQVGLENGHYLDLSLHSDAEEGDEIHDKDRPEHRDVENLEKGTAEGDHLYWPLGSCKTRVDLKKKFTITKVVTVALVAEYQNLNSGKRLQELIRFLFVAKKWIWAIGLFLFIVSNHR